MIPKAAPLSPPVDVLDAFYNAFLAYRDPARPLKCCTHYEKLEAAFSTPEVQEWMPEARIPPGMVLVPIDPTWSMIEAFLDLDVSRINKLITKGVPGNPKSEYRIGDKFVKQLYAAMLAAAR